MAKDHEQLLRPHVATIQEWVDTNITEGVALSSAKIAEQLAPTLQVSAEDITAGFRLLVKSGVITGIEGRRKVGYCRPGYGGKSVSVKQVSGAEEPGVEPEVKSCVELGKGRRVYNVDRYNWALQKWNGSNWVSQAYWSTLESALTGVARRLVTDELKGLAFNATDLDTLVETLRLVEANVLASLEKRVSSEAVSVSSSTVLEHISEDIVADVVV